METSTHSVFQMKGLSSEAMSSIFVDLEMRNASAVEGRYAVSEFDDVRIVRATSHGGAYEIQRHNWHIAASGPGHCFVCLPLGGEIRLRQDGNICVLRPFDLGLVDTRREYTVGIPAGADALWIRIDASRLDWRLPGEPEIFARRIDGDEGSGHVASSFLRSVTSQADRLSQQSRATLVPMMADLLVEAAASLAPALRQPAAFRTSSQRTFERARAYIDRHLDDEELDPDRIGRAVGISPRYLGHLFAAEGTTTMGWVSKRRLDLCRRKLEGEVWRPGVITELALSSGFTNVSSFNRAFKAAFGKTPREAMISASQHRLAQN